VQLEPGAGGAETNHHTIGNRQLAHRLSVNKGAVRAKVNQFPASLTVPEFEMMARDKGAVNHNIIVFGASNPDDGVLFEGPTADWLSLRWMNEKNRDHNGNPDDEKLSYGISEQGYGRSRV